MLYLSPPSTWRVREAQAAGLIGSIHTPRQGNSLVFGSLRCFDNGCFGKGFPGEAAWWQWLQEWVADSRSMAGKVLFAVAPDVVADAEATARRSAPWLEPIRGLGVPAAFVAQDGMERLPINWDGFDVLFIGGSTEWKLGSEARAISAEAIARGKPVHMGRVNSQRRYDIAESFGCSYVDGTFIRFGPTKNLPIVHEWCLPKPRRQQLMTESFGKPAAPAGKGRGQAEDRADGVPRDARGGYVLPGLDGSPPLLHKNGNPIGRVRASTIKNHVTDKTGVSKWRVDMVQTGLAKDPALAAENMKAVAAEDKTWIRNVGERAFVVGGGKVAADRGTAFHELTERIKKGEQVSPDEIHESLAAVDVDAYLQLLAEVNLRPVPGMQERVVLLEHGGGGTFDDMFEWFNPGTEQYELLIGDTKSGRDIWKYGSLEIIAQMIQYTRAQGIWRSPKDGGAEPWGDYLPMPAVSQSHVAIVHAPQNGTAEAFIVDIAGAQEVIDAALTIRRWQSDAKHRVRSIGKVDLREAAYVAPGNSVSGTTATTEAFHQPEPNGPWAPVRPAEDEYAAKEVARRQVTPDQQAQADKAAERLAKVAAMSNPNTDGDDEPERVMLGGATNDAVDKLPAGYVPPFDERDPVTGRKKRTCGHCRKPGHTQKNCPENPASAKFAGDVGRTVTGTDRDISLDEHMAGLAASHPGGVFPDDPPMATPALVTEPIAEIEAADMADGDDAPPPPVRWSVPGQQVTAEELTAYNATAGQAPHIDDPAPSDLPWCHLAHAHEWTSEHPAAPGQWVCATTGKPSKEAYEGSAIQGPYAKPLPSPAAAEAPTEPAHWTTPPDMTAWSITNARKQADVLVIRAKAIAAGTWTDAYESQAQARYQALG